MSNLQDVPDTAAEFEAKSASGQTKVTGSVGPKGHVLITVMRDGHQVERFEMGCETNLGPHSMLQTDGKNLYISQKQAHPDTKPEVVAIV